MRRFKFAKLVRDKIVDSIKDWGGIPNHKKLNKNKHVEFLIKKLKEESKEIQNSSSEEILEEIADVQEIVDTLLDILGISKEELKAMQIKKNNNNGGFKNGDYIEFVDVSDEYPGLKYFLDNPEKYPEITD